MSDNKENVALSSPWEGIHHVLMAMFKDDDEIVVDQEINYDDYTLNIIVYNKDKYDALCRVLKKNYEFGNVTLNILIEDISDEGKIYKPIDDIETIFKDNPIFNRVERLENIQGVEIDYCVFEKQVIQYFDDDLTDIHGLKSRLAQDMALEIFEIDEPINFCTDSSDLELADKEEA